MLILDQDLQRTPAASELFTLRRIVWGAILSLGFSQIVTADTPAIRESTAGRGGTLIARFAPKRLADVLIRRTPLGISLGGRTFPVELAPGTPGRMQGLVDGRLSVEVDYEYLPEARVVRWTTRLRNTTAQSLHNVEVTPLAIPMAIVPDRDRPRVRHLTGSVHLDAAYPPRAFRVQEERIMTHIRAQPVRIGSGQGFSAKEYSPELQLAVGPYGGMAGFYVAFEWSSRWFLEATWARDSFKSESRPEFLVRGNVGLGKLSLSPGEEVVLPRIHLGFWEGPDWSAADRAIRGYVRNALGAKLNGRIPLAPVSYDTWDGIYESLEVGDLKRQADRAAQLGAEYFALDAGWYPIKEDFGDGLGNWVVDSKKFPNGIEELSQHVRNLGMGFGLWHMIEVAAAGTAAPKDHPAIYHPYSATHLSLRMDLKEGQQFALDTLRQWIRDWHLTWMRWEFTEPAWTYDLDPSGKTTLAYIAGLYRVIDTLRAEHPELYIEGCAGGGMRMDWGLAVRTHGTWLNDHTNDADVVRFMQTGASRFWPAHFLNMAVPAHRRSGDAEVNPHNLLSRMVGTLSFNGDIAQWSPEATKQAAHYVATYKNFRALLDGPVEFPLEQPRSDRDWDMVLAGEPGRRRLLFAFRMEGADALTVNLPEGRWTRLLGADTATLQADRGKATLRLDRNTSALWELLP